MAHFINSPCIGCGACKRVCPTGAISGETKDLHVIDDRLCIDCGSCGRVCPKAAVNDASGSVVEKIKKTLWLKPRILQDQCYACENCVGACPVDALEMKSPNLALEENVAVLARPEACVSCGWCLENCQFGAISMEVIDVHA